MKRNANLFLLFVSSLIIGVIGFYLAGNNIIISIYLALQLFVLEADAALINSNYFLAFSYFSCPLLTATAVINIVMHYAKGGINAWRRNQLNNHVVVCGLSRTSVPLIKDFLKEGKSIVVIDVEEKKHQFLNIRSSNIFYIDGDPRDKSKLLLANLHKSRYVLIYSVNDVLNIEISKLVLNELKSYSKELANNKERTISIYSHIVDEFNLEIFKNYVDTNVDNNSIHIDYHVSNIYTKAASSIIQNLSPDRFSVFDNQTKQIEICIQPLNNMGIAFLKEAAHLYHFPNLKKLKIHVIDDNIEKKKKNLLNRIPLIEKVIDLSCHEKCDFYSNAKISDINEISVFFLSEEVDSENLVYARRLRQMFFDIHERLDFPKLAVALHEDSAISELSGNLGSESSFLNISLNNIYSDYCNIENIIRNKEHFDIIAMQIHNLYLDKHLDKGALGNVWAKLSDSEKDSNRYPARHFPVKLRFLGINVEMLMSNSSNGSIENIDEKQTEIVGRMEHNRWVAEKLLTGFVRGKKLKDSKLQKELKGKMKYHLDIRDWEELSKEDQAKDLMAIDQLKMIVNSIN